MPLAKGYTTLKVIMFVLKIIIVQNVQMKIELMVAQNPIKLANNYI